MTDDDPGSLQDKSWLSKLATAFSSEPQSQEDLAAILRVAHENKIIDSDALEIIEGALHVSNQQVREIMIPRSQMVIIKQDAKLEDILDIAISSNHSRFPVVADSIDDVTGILLAKELLPLVIEGAESFDIKKYIRSASIIPESKRLNVLLQEFREQRYHMAIVIDEYGGVAGLVTIEDILEEIVGEIEDETDKEENAHIRPQADGKFLVEALTPIEDFNEFFEVGLRDDAFDTIGGLVMQAFGRLPAVGECVTISNFTFCVKEGDNRQVKLLDVTKSTR